MPTLTREEQHQQTLHNMIDALLHKDFQRWLTHFHQDVEFQQFTPVMSMRGLRRGHQGLIEHFEQSQHEAEMLSYEPRQFLAEGNTAVMLGEIHFRVQNTGREMRTSMVHVFTFRGDKIANVRVYGEADNVIEAFSHH